MLLDVQPDPPVSSCQFATCTPTCFQQYCKTLRRHDSTWQCYPQVRHVGVSNETSYGVMRFVQLAQQFNLPRIVSIQNCYNLLARGQFDTDLAEVCAPRQCNVGLLAYSPLAGGALSGKYVDGRADPKARFNMFPGKSSQVYPKQ